MASYIQNKKCPKCGHETTSKICPKCKNKTTPSGKWSVRFRIVNEDGSIIQKRLSGFDTKLQTENAHREFMSSYIAPNINLKTSLTFNQLYALYLDYKKARLKPSTIYDINNVVKKRVIPFFGEMKVNEITKQTVLKWQAELDKAGFSYKYKTNIRGFLSAIFKYAVMYCDLPFNPVLQVEPFRNTEPKKEMQIWSQEEFVKFINCIDDLTFKTFFATLYFSGCRKGELFAINWNDINFKTGILSINKSLTRKEEGKPFAITTTKNSSSNRKILLPPVCLDLLKDLKEQNNNNFVFGGEKPLAENTVTRKLKLYCETSGVKLIRLHDFRHSHASLLIGNGENILLVAKRLGHSDIEQTLNTYGHLMPNAESEAIGKIDIKI